MMTPSPTPLTKENIMSNQSTKSRTIVSVSVSADDPTKTYSETYELKEENFTAVTTSLPILGDLVYAQRDGMDAWDLCEYLGDHWRDRFGEVIKGDTAVNAWAPPFPNGRRFIGATGAEYEAPPWTQ